MSALFLILLLADIVILVASQAQKQAWAHQICANTSVLCDHPVPLVVAGIILGGIFFVQK